MREILFHGKRVDNGDWVDGYYYPDFQDTTVAFILCKDDGIVYEVAPETVGQCTGLKDKNGKRIFEDDIVSEIGMYLISKFSNGSFNFVTRREKMVVSPVDTTQYAVIGNIHDNPELLEKQSKNLFYNY